MKEKNFKKLGFFSALSICISSIVGIGIFFKNGSIASNVNGDGSAWLATWIISGVIAFLVAIHFGKIAMIKDKGTGGLSSWSQRIATKNQNWFRHIVTINYSFFYNSILLIVLSFFTIEIFGKFLEAINHNVTLPIYAVAILSLCLLFFYIAMNKISVKSSGLFSSITTILKFIPLILALVVGISMPTTHYNGGENAFVPKDSNVLDSFQGIMKSLPAALFAFDAFVGVGSMAKKVKGGEKVISKIIVTAMVFVVISYLLIAVSSILHYGSVKGDSNAIVQIIMDVFGNNPKIANGFKVFIIFFLFISALGTTNAITSAALSEFENISFTEKVFFSKQLNTKFCYKKTALIYFASSLLCWSLIAYIPAIIMNSDSFVDGMSNIIVLFFFLIYATLIFLYWKNIYKKQLIYKSKNPWLYTVLVFISVVGVCLSMLLSLLFTLVSAIENPFAPSSWGLYGGTWYINNLGVIILYLVFSVMFILLPLINYSLFWFKKEKNIFKDIDLELCSQYNDKNTIIIGTKIIKI